MASNADIFIAERGGTTRLRLYKHAIRSPKGPRLIAAAIRSAAGTYIQTNTHTHPKHIHKTFNNSTSIKPIRKPSSPLGSYNPGASQMATRKGPVSPRNSGLECRVIAERGGTTRLRVTFVGSHSISWPIQACQKKSEGAPINSGRDTVCGRYIHTYKHTHPKHIHKTFNNSTRIKPIRKPSSPLGSCNPGAPPMARDGGPDRPYPGKVRSCPGTVASNAEL